MKIRSGFVSNSSSSSFCIIGIYDSDIAEQMMKMDKCGHDEFQGAMCSGENFDYVGSSSWDEKTDEYGIEPYRVGKFIESFGEETTIRDMKSAVRAKLEKFGVSVPLSKITLEYGEVSSE